jgi:N utilization substance protein A
MVNFSVVEALTQIAREKSVDRELVVNTLADALISAAKRRYGNTDNYEAVIDQTTGSMDVYMRRTVVEEVVDPALEVSLEDAQAVEPGSELGGVLRERLNFADFGRNAIQTAKQILVQRVREAERERIYDEFSNRVGTVESGIVQQISHGDIILNLGRAEAAVPFKDQIRRERYRQGDTVKGYVYEVLKVSRGPQILLSRTHPELLKRFFAAEVPEIAEGIVQIHSVAREPGERAKIAVSSRDDRVDPVGACVGVKGSRVQTVVRELSGERIDIVPWSEEVESYIARSLSPAVVARVIVDRRRHHATVLVASDQLSLAIGKGGQNSRLAAQLTGWGLDIITDEEHQRRRAQSERMQQVFRLINGVSEMISLSLATSGFHSVREIAESSLEMLRSVPGLEDDAAATRLRDAAAVFVAEHGDLSELPAPEPTEAPAAEAAASTETEAAVEPSTVPEPQGSEGEPAGASGAPEGSAPAEGGTGETGPADGGKNEDDGDQAGPATV